MEMGGVIHPEKGALVYKKTTQVETVPPLDGSGQPRKIKKVTSETSWIGKSDKKGKGKGKKKGETPLLSAEEGAEEPWHDEEVEHNPLYSDDAYDSDFSNPLYQRRLSTSEGAVMAAAADLARGDRQPLVPPRDGGRAARGRQPGSGDRERSREYVDYLSAQPGLDSADTLF